MNLFTKIFGSIALSTILVACGGGGSDDSITAPSNFNTALYNNAWDKALVYKPYTSTPILLKDLGDHAPAPVAISLHGCDGVQEYNRSGGDKYFPILLAMQGYLVIEPDSYYGMKFGPGSNLCYTDPKTNTTIWPSVSVVADRAFDAEYAINKVKDSKFWDQKNLLVQGQSQGFYLVEWLRPKYTSIVTKWLFSGYSTCFQNRYDFTNAKPTLIINSDADSSVNCTDYIQRAYPNVSIKLIKGNYHVPIWSPEGYEIVKNWVKL